MAKLSNVLHSDDEDNRLMFYCPGCEMHHSIVYGEGRWAWDGNTEKPTFSPSVLVHWTKYNVPLDEQLNLAKKGKEIPHTPMICHSFIVNGQFQFLSDCTHALAGQTVDLPEIEDD